MKHALGLRVAFLSCVLAGACPAQAQTFPKTDWFHEVFQRPGTPAQVPGPEKLRDYVADGKLRLTLDDAIRLALLNDTDVRVDKLQVESTQLSITRAYSPFDPSLTSSFGATRSVSPTSNQLTSGQSVFSNLSQQSQVTYQQLFQTGTIFNTNFSSGRNSNNNLFATFNPNFFSTLSFTFTQPLLRNRGLFINRAPILIARRNYKQSIATFEGQVNDAVQQVVAFYWAVVQARENLVVVQKSVDQAQASYNHDKRQLELGALPPLNIYQSESELATRRVSAIQAEYSLKEAEDTFRQILGADLDSQVGALDLDLIEPTEPAGDLLTMDVAQALQRALDHRPEFEVLRQQLVVDDMNIRLAHNELQPSLNLQGNYASSGLGGNQIDTTQTPPVVIAQGGFGDSISQLGSFKYPTYGFSLTLTLPIKNRQGEADLASSEISKRRDLYSERRNEQTISLQVRNAIHQLEQSKLTLAASKISRDLAQKNLEAQQRKYELGAVDIFFVLDAQTALATAESSLVSAQVNYQEAVVAVQHSTGELLDRFNVQVAEPKK